MTNLPQITVPVELVQGGADTLFAARARPRQAVRYTGSHSVGTAIVPDAGHAIALERSRDRFADIMISTLRRFQRS